MAGTGIGKRLPGRGALDEFGDFQTPLILAQRVCRLLSAQGVAPASIIEPTCGKGSFLLAALDCFPTVERAVGFDINAGYVTDAARALSGHPYFEKVTLTHRDAFSVEWAAVMADLPEPILVLGNPPWVTNSALESMGSTNLPHKSNFNALPGLAALTGKANFDISEWMLIHLLESAGTRRVTMAMLCKTAAARRTLVYLWKTGRGITRSSIRGIDSKKHFSAAVAACLFICETSAGVGATSCAVYEDLDASSSQTSFGYFENQLVANLAAYERLKQFRSLDEKHSHYRWRSGIKHDCSRVMELRRDHDRLVNGFAEMLALEQDYLFPMLKSSDLANGEHIRPERWMIVPHRRIGEDTGAIARNAPQTWRYLNEHGPMLDARKSSLYRGKPRFSVFGVGDYTFAPWKIAISGLYKRLKFAVVGPVNGKPVVFDDTCNFLPCQTEIEARLLVQLLDSSVAKEFFESIIFWDAKRPITIDLLNRLDLMTLAEELRVDARLKAAQTAERASQAFPQLRLL